MRKQKAKKNIFLPHIRLNPKTDQDIINWLESLNQSYGEKGQAIKNALRNSLNAKLSPNSQNLPTSPMNQGELLSDIRRIIDASLESSLSGLQLTGTIQKTQTEETDVKDILDNFASLMI